MRRIKVTPEGKLQAAKECAEEKVSISEQAKGLGLGRATMREWVYRYKAQGARAFFDTGVNKVYSEELKAKAVEDYLSGKGSQATIAAKYGLRTKTQLQQWIKMYNSGRRFRHKMSGGSRMKQGRETTQEERVAIAKDCIATGENYGETAIKHNVSYQQVYQWTRKYKEYGEAGLEDRRGKRMKDQVPRSHEEELEIEVAKLKRELYETKMERDLLKKLDEIVRRDAYRK